MIALCEAKDESHNLYVCRETHETLYILSSW